jgi:uncharacterized protein YndB with AHSA1/START domain
MAPRHVHEVYIRATSDEVWTGLTDPRLTVQYFHGTAVRSAWHAGGDVVYETADGAPAVVGEIDEIDPPRLLSMSFRMVYEPELAAEPASHVRWELTPVGDTTRVGLVHGRLFDSPATWAAALHGWRPVLDGLKTLLETGAPIGSIPDDRSDDRPGDPLATWHRQLGVETNGETWSLLARDDRTPDDDEAMVRAAYASAYHWARAEGRTAANEARAEWLVSRVHVVLGRGDLALHHADRCAAVTAAAGLDDFDLAYAHEARARALACLGRIDEAGAARDAAVAVPVADPEDAAIVSSDLAGGPWFGLPVPPA